VVDGPRALAAEPVGLMRALRASPRAVLLAPLVPARIVGVTLSEWRLAATRGEALSMASNSLFLIASKVAAMGIGFLCWLAAARMFSASNVGLASAAVSATTLVAQLALVGIGSSVIGLFPAQRDPARLLDSAISLVWIAAIAAAAVFLVVAAVALGDLAVVARDPRFALCFVAFACAGTVGVLMDQTSTVIRRGDQAMTRNVACGAMTLALVPAALMVSDADRSLAVFAAWTAGALVMVGLGAWQLSRRPLEYSFRPRLTRDLVKPLLLLGIPNHVLTLAERLPGAVLPILVTEMLSPAENAYWYGVWMMGWVVFIIPIQIGITLYAEASHRPDDLRRLAGDALRLSLGLGALAAVVAVAGAGLALSLLGHAYAAAGELPLRIVVVAVLPMTLVEVYYGVCRATRHLGEAAATGLLSATTALAAAVAVAADHGLVGIAVVWLTVQVVTGMWAAVRLTFLLRHAPVSIPVAAPVRRWRP
jgi:O-antigen/teichoic acid export membrane protein